MRTLAALLLSCLPLPALACPGVGPASVEVELPTAGISVEQVRDVAAHAPFGVAAPRISGGETWTTNGLTKSTLKVEASIKGLSSGPCFRATSVRLTVSVADPVRVLITDRYAPGTCAYQAILDHEMQHVDILRRGRILYADRYRAYVAAAVAGVDFRDIDDANRRISAAVDGVTRELDTALGAANGSIDTRESYLANQARCPAW